jgi:hypothetical protein
MSVSADCTEFAPNGLKSSICLLHRELHSRECLSAVNRANNPSKTEASLLSCSPDGDSAVQGVALAESAGGDQNWYRRACRKLEPASLHDRPIRGSELYSEL